MIRDDVLDKARAMLSSRIAAAVKVKLGPARKNDCQEYQFSTARCLFFLDFLRRKVVLSKEHRTADIKSAC